MPHDGFWLKVQQRGNMCATVREFKAGQFGEAFLRRPARGVLAAQVRAHAGGFGSRFWVVSAAQTATGPRQVNSPNTVKSCAFSVSSEVMPALR